MKQVSLFSQITKNTPTVPDNCRGLKIYKVITLNSGREKCFKLYCSNKNTDEDDIKKYMEKYHKFLEVINIQEVDIS